jgi:hypothetical protein
MALQMTQHAMLCHAETLMASIHDQIEIAHYLGINEIEITAREIFAVKSWIGDRRLKSLNLANDRTSKDYDSIMEIESPNDPTAIVRVGIEYERTIQSRERYIEIRKSFDGEKRLNCLLYFVEGDEAALHISQLVYSRKLPVAVVTLSRFQSARINATVLTLIAEEIHPLPLWQWLSRLAAQ